mmetsp:Transcript_107634/g.246399  ORF Transcript_107634/g.246399 Transcript_107634/m.246399 type:complete len:900 (+) Transcript_107634:636-3335(+)
MVGPPKFLTSAEVLFEPAESYSISRVTVVFTANADVLPESLVVITLGGLVRDPAAIEADATIQVDAQGTGPARIWGANAALFERNLAEWDAVTGTLTLQVIERSADFQLVAAGTEISFFMGQDQGFRLPFAMYENDPSFLIQIPQAGLPEQQFDRSSRVNRVNKGFEISELQYDDPTQVSFPNRPTDVSILFRPNVALPAGSIIRLTLPNFRCVGTRLRLSPPPLYPLFTTHTKFLMDTGGEAWHYGTWNQTSFTLDMEVALGELVPNDGVSGVALLQDHANCTLPDLLDENDPDLTIEVTQGQVIYPEPVKRSEKVVSRTFLISTFDYQPRQKESTFLWTITIQPTVNITEFPIEITMPRVNNILNKRNIHLTGKDANRILAQTAYWNQTTFKLTLPVPPAQQLDAFQTFEFKIEESQGFTLPPELFKNDPGLTISNAGNILEEPVKVSPMVGDGPYANQRFCMYQYETGVRTGDFSRCSQDPCNPPLKDPCSQRELARCGCADLRAEPSPMSIEGFQLYSEDDVGFVPEAQQCPEDQNLLHEMQTITWSDDRTASEDQTTLVIQNISSVRTGYYRVCLMHENNVFDVGLLSVRPACESPKVLVDGTCVMYCPSTKTPIAGECQEDPAARLPAENNALMVSVNMEHATAVENQVYRRFSDDPDRVYFVYRFTYEMATVLDSSVSRFVVSSISNGTGDNPAVRVNVVVSASEESEGVADEDQSRTAQGVLSLLRALQQDENSLVFASQFLESMDKTYVPVPVEVRRCPDFPVYRTICPYMDTLLNPLGSAIIFGVSAIGCVVVLMVLFLQLWRIDFDYVAVQDPFDNRLHRKTKETLAPSAAAEYSRSWLEHRWVENEKAVQETRKKREREQAAERRTQRLNDMFGSMNRPGMLALRAS